MRRLHASSAAAALFAVSVAVSVNGGCAGSGPAPSRGASRAQGESASPPAPAVRLAVDFVDIETGGGVVCRWRVVDEEGFVLEEGVGTRVERLVPRARMTVEASPAFEAWDVGELRASFDLFDPENANGVEEEIGFTFDPELRGEGP